METICRLRLPIVIVIINNNGIYSGIEKEYWDSMLDDTTNAMVPSTALLPDARYEKIADAFGGVGYFVRTPGKILPNGFYN